MPAIRQHHTPTVGGRYDADAMRARLRDADGLRAAHAWVDQDGDPEAKASYAFIHHLVEPDGTVGPASTTACIAGIGVLNGGRIGVDGVRAARWARDRAGIWRHLAIHLEDADMEAPPLADIASASDLGLIAKAGLGPMQLTDEGEFIARFSAFGIVDSQGHVTTRTTFEDGVDVVVGAWGHNRLALPAGRGTVRVADDGAYLHGRFFTDTAHGRDTYLTVRNLGELQQWSYLAVVLDARPVDVDGREVTELTRLQLVSVDPVDVGANPRTATIAIKGLSTSVRALADDVDDIVAALQRRAEVRMRAGRHIGAATLDEAAALARRLRSAASDIEAMLTVDTRPIVSAATARVARARAVLSRVTNV